MPTRFIYFVVLFCLHKINDERTIYSLYHLLSGKKSFQTIQDAHLFQIAQFYKTCDFLTRKQFDEIIEELEKQNLVTATNEQYYKLTRDGLTYMKKESENHPFLSYLNGWDYQYANIFWQRISLLVQVTSHLANQDRNYIPIQRKKPLLKWLKNYLLHNRFNRKELSDRLYHELIHVLEDCREIDPSVFVIRLTGFETIGLTEKQACESLKIEQTLYHFQFQALLHYILFRIQKEPKTFMLLASLITDIETNLLLTDTSKKTLVLLNKGFSLEQIAQIRKLKVSTIQDHIVELALQMNSFQIEPFVGKEKIKLITAAHKQATSKQLKQIRELVPEATYFQIRLVLTRLGEDNEF
ncbi:helix-turn-helix domain-containing protein [Robertmurraya sp. DFI.2.37]|uniref:helix-turn-helix domain-containing protein n=1 Tax=Robertmurraya sp. DFI.2.37 TaxID=3031819 RepID=UPI001243D0DC|nr:helix-turn-helix domain-containing protein [Robertmurraya sp. DFI.2.37]MDF1507685.1 helix-turn-helix domain-containing protein [Robertmurraya sp. DFI.2.37]